MLQVSLMLSMLTLISEEMGLSVISNLGWATYWWLQSRNSSSLQLGAYVNRIFQLLYYMTYNLKLTLPQVHE